MIGNKRTHSRKLRVWLFGTIALGLWWVTPASAFVFGEPLPPLPPLPGPGGPPPGVNIPPGGGVVPPPGTIEPGPIEPPPIVGTGTPPDPDVTAPPVSGSDGPAPTAPPDLAAAPEPATLAMGLAGAGLFAALGWWRRRQNA